MIGPWSSGQRVFTFYSDDPSLNTTEVNSVLKKEIYKKGPTMATNHFIMPNAKCQLLSTQTLNLVHF